MVEIARRTTYVGIHPAEETELILVDVPQRYRPVGVCALEPPHGHTVP